MPLYKIPALFRNKFIIVRHYFYHHIQTTVARGLEYYHYVKKNLKARSMIVSRCLNLFLTGAATNGKKFSGKSHYSDLLFI